MVTEGLAGLVRRHDPDRYYCTLFAPAARQPALFTLYAFNHELARAHEAAREPALALIRLQWWREAVEGAARAHEVAAPLSEAVAAGVLATAPLLAMIEAREAETEAAGTLAALIARLMLGPGSLAAAAGQVLGADPPALHRLRTLGAGVGLAGLVRNIAANARHGRCQIPLDLLSDHGLTAEAFIADPAGPAAAPAVAVLRVHARTLLGRARPLQRAWVSAGLPAVLARRDLGRGPMVGARGIGDRLAVLTAATRALA